MASEKPKGRKWDGKSRVSNDLYRKNYNKIFQKKDDPFNIEVKKERKPSKEELEELDERNGF
jgi:hypothetical protein